jgi:hypothetical protein
MPRSEWQTPETVLRGVGMGYRKWCKDLQVNEDFSWSRFWHVQLYDFGGYSARVVIDGGLVGLWEL